MATPAQIAANRRNSLLSTGPRSEEGKAVSRFNALKTGIQAYSQIIPGEDPAALEELADGYHLQFRPATPVERFLVDILANADWQLRRLYTVEARLWELSLADGASGLGEAYQHNLPAFTRLYRRIEAVERSFYRALNELQRLQSGLAPDPDLRAPAPDPRPAAPVVPPAPAELASFSTQRPPHRNPEDNPALRL